MKLELVENCYPVVRGGEFFLRYGHGISEYTVGIPNQGNWFLFQEEDSRNYFLLVRNDLSVAVYKINQNQVIDSVVISGRKLEELLIGTRFKNLYDVPTKIMVKAVLMESGVKV